MKDEVVLVRAAVIQTLLLLLVACTIHKQEEKPAQAASASAEEVARSLGNPLLANKGDINAVNISVSSEDELKKVDNGSEDELVWTNPDDPDAEIPGLTAIFENKKLGRGWQIDMGRSIQLARRQELPLTVWFHDSLISPKSGQLGKEYLETKEFEDWVGTRAVCVRLDSGASLSDTNSDNAKYKADNINALQRRYGLTKKPSFAVITPNGKIVARIDGFDGFLSGFVQELKAGVALAQKKYDEYKGELAERGYRDWKSARGDRHVFAKLMRVDPKHEVAYLRESGGRITRTKITQFCKEDAELLRSKLPVKPDLPSENPDEL